MNRVQDSYIEKCRICLKIKKKIRFKFIRYGRYAFTDEKGKRWDGKTCPSCLLEKKALWKRENRVPIPRDNHRHEGTRTARQSERTAEKFFQSKGYSTTICTVTGPDLTIQKRGVSRTVEVKTARKEKARAFFVSRVEPKRERDDLIAYVFRDKVVVRRMTEHIKCFGPGKDACVSRFFVHPLDIQDKCRSKTGFKGVCFRKRSKTRPWFAHLWFNGKQISAGYFASLENAAKAYDSKAKELYGPFAKLNFPEDL